MNLNQVHVSIIDIFTTPIIMLLVSISCFKFSNYKKIILSFLLYPLFIFLIFLCNDYLRIQSLGFLLYLLFIVTFLTNPNNRDLKLLNQTLTIFLIFKNIRYFLNVPFYIFKAFEINRNIIIILIIYLSELFGTLIIIKKINKEFPSLDSFFMDSTSYTTLILFSLIIQWSFFYFQNINNHYDELVFYSFLFVLTSVFYFYLLFKAQYTNIENLLKKKQVEQEIIALKKYSSLINEKQNQLRKFRHDYKNLILTLTSLAHENKIEEMKTYLQELNVYSQEQLELVHLPFKDLDTIKNSIIRGFIFSKLLEFEMNHLEIEFQSESNLAEINLDNFNLIRILGIYFDNALEHLSDHQEGKFTLRILENDAAHFFTIKNSYYGDKLLIREIIQQGFTTKDGHSGQGLDTIEVIKQKYPQLSVQYQQGEFFQVQLIIEKNKE